MAEAEKVADLVQRRRLGAGRDRRHSSARERSASRARCRGASKSKQSKHGEKMSVLSSGGTIKSVRNVLSTQGFQCETARTPAVERSRQENSSSPSSSTFRFLAPKDRYAMRQKKTR